MFKKTFVPHPYSGTDRVVLGLDIPKSEVNWTSATVTATRVVSTDENAGGLVVGSGLEKDVSDDKTETILLTLLGTTGAGLYKLAFALESEGTDKYTHYLIVWIVPPVLTVAEEAGLLGDEGQVLLGDEGQTLIID